MNRRGAARDMLATWDEAMGGVLEGLRAVGVF
jgi:hypothetical protein